MPLSDGTKAIATNAAWASAATADRTAPDDASLTPPIVIADGWPASFSAAGGNTPRRPVFNELEYRKDSSIKDIINFGILPWDTDVDTLDTGVKQANGVIYRALVDNGPTYSNATDPTAAGQTVWEVVSGTLAVPAAPAAPTAVAANGTLDWSWACPKDNGAAVTAFDLQWRQQGQSGFTTVSALTTGRYLLTGLTNGTTYEAQVQATNSVGDSGYGALGMATPVAAVPGGGNTLALRADTGSASGEIDLDWLAPAANGATITGYTYQWRTSGQAYASARQGTTTNTQATVGSLANGTAYFFQVFATNTVGDGPVSNEDSATPAAPFVPPSDTAPDTPDAPEFDVIDFETILWRWSFPADDGGQSITRFDFQWRIQGNNWVAGNVVQLTESCYLQENRNESTTYEGRVRATNIVGTSGWSGDTPATTPAEPIIPMPPADTVPDAPEAITGTPRLPLIVDWTWELPDDNGGQVIESYDFQWRYDGDSWANVNFTGGLEVSYYRVAIADTTSGVQARARAINSVGTGAWRTSSVLAAGDLLAHTVPGLPTAHTGTPRRPLVIDWVWEVPNSNGGQRIESYDHQWRYSGSGWSGNTVTTESTYRRITVPNANRSVQARVRARNSVGVSAAWGGTVTVASGDLLIALPPPAPSAPSTPSGRAVTPRIIEWMWTPPTGQSIIDTEVQYRASGASWPDIVYVGLTTPEIQQGDTVVGSTFQARARARAAVGASPWSATGSFVGTLGMSRVYVASSDPPDSIQVYDLSGNRQTGEEFTVATTSPSGLAVTATRVYVANATGTESILVYDLSGNRQTSEEFTVATTSPSGLAVTATRVYVANAAGTASIQVYDLSGNRQTSEEFTVAAASPFGLAVTATRVYVANAAGTESILVYDLSGNRQTGEEFTVATTLPLGLAVTATRVYVTNSVTPDSIQVYDLSGNRQTSEEFTVATAIPNGLAVLIV